MTWREQLIARILLLIARMVADDPAIRDELKHLASHIAVNAPPAVDRDGTAGPASREP